ncbi:glutamine--fructose-6-phosphate transaminase (isomerizing) [Exilibacterium tricleocarpae]|uniref:Glutamine--fructose-6-phosphate aminotransferase [isomerizing] n=1 Tax=Exilibacterium tricleocarpae TaxID=2591008 RepID=A0A545TNR5_9GAMM|nr:glutamine--fructose-6-phosphate transaminase (isomerizing) [Exilibacterium tricleocarpae]TQV78867.1 glutamine--fructose-6-phosphate transaminase (isomerizing) [Exilibacterium tricleocarpae]
MCGIFCYSGAGAAATVIAGLRRLEYRGYDSWGLGIGGDTAVEYHKTLQPLQTATAPRPKGDDGIAVGHTRWATHGAVTIANCHPHLSADGQLALVHNGIVENFLALKQQLLASGTDFSSETDTEVALRLLENQLALLNEDPDAEAVVQALRMTFLQLQGRNTLVLLDNRHRQIIAIRQGSPLVAGRKIAAATATESGADNHCEASVPGVDTAFFLASDALSFAEHTTESAVVHDRQVVVCRRNSITAQCVDTRKPQPLQWHHHRFPQITLDRKGCEHFMLKEILEQWHTIEQAAQLCDSQLSTLVDKIHHTKALYLTGAGAAYFVAEHIAHMIRRATGIRAQAIPAYDYTCYLPLMQPGEVLLAISQSGETADTLRFIQQAKNLGVNIASVVNMPGATLTQVSDFAFNSHCGPEACVLSTKSGTAQLSFGYLLSEALAGRTPAAKLAIGQLAQSLHAYLSAGTLGTIAALAEKISGEHIFLLGESKYTAPAKIGALNIKEASYIHAESFVAGELKHGVIALIEPGTPVIFFMDAGNRDYLSGVVAEVKARGGFTIGIAHQPESFFDHTLVIPPLAETAGIIASIIPCQLLAYYLSVQRGLNPDQPRNLAKSVTVI